MDRYTKQTFLTSAVTILAMVAGALLIENLAWLMAWAAVLFVGNIVALVILAHYELQAYARYLHAEYSRQAKR